MAQGDSKSVTVSTWNGRPEGCGVAPPASSRVASTAQPVIRREGKGRVFYEAHGHNEKVYANKLLLEHILAGMQYVLGDLSADDSPRDRRP